MALGQPAPMASGQSVVPIVVDCFQRLDGLWRKPYSEKNVELCDTILRDIRNIAGREYDRSSDPLALLVQAYCNRYLFELEKASEQIEVLLKKSSALDERAQWSIRLLASDIYLQMGKNLNALKVISQDSEHWAKPAMSDLAFHALFANGLWKQINALQQTIFENDEKVFPHKTYLFSLVRDRKFAELKSYFFVKNHNNDSFNKANIFEEFQLDESGIVLALNKRSNFPSRKLEKLSFWTDQLVKAVALLQQFAPEEFETVEDGVTYVLQLDGSYIAFREDNTDFEGYGQTKEEALKNLNSGHSEDIESCNWLDADISAPFNDEDITSFSTAQQTQNNQVSYRPGVGLIVGI